MDLHTLFQSIIPNRSVSTYHIDAEAEIVPGEPILGAGGVMYANNSPGATTYTITADDAVYTIVAPLVSA